MRKAIYIGTSGWSYKHWRNDLYVSWWPANTYLSYYSQFFNVSEINTSFYHLPAPETIYGWLEKVPPGFIFCPKMSRYLTHMKKLHDPEEPLERFFSVFDIMHAQMGPVLIQLPAQVKFNAAIAGYFYNLLSTRYGNYSFAMEIRHTSWLEKSSIDLMRQYNIALVISQSGNIFPYAEEITAKHIYVRFHGPQALYASGYTTAMLRYYAAKFIEWQQQGHQIWAFFNNDVMGFAYKNAIHLKEILGTNEIGG